MFAVVSALYPIRESLWSYNPFLLVHNARLGHEASQDVIVEVKGVKVVDSVLTR